VNPELVVVLITLCLLCVAGVSALSTRIRVAAPLILVLLGSLVGFLPMVPAFEVDPEWILIGVLPPLLFSSAVSMPAMSFRRELRSITGLSVGLVLVSSVLLGWFFTVTLNISLAWGIALGAIVSPTDAVATAIARRVGVPSRVLTMLEGESLLNDATALVLLRSAIAAAAGGIAMGAVVVDFLWALGAAAAIGFGVGWLQLWLRARVADPVISTVISYAVPFLAAVPAEQVGASGLVAAVVAGLVSGYGAPRMLSAQARLSDAQNWRTAELVLESAIFLLMGLQLHGLMTHASHSEGAVATLGLVAMAGLLLTIAIRAAYVAILVRSQSRRTRRQQGNQERLAMMQSYVDARIAHPDQGFGRPSRGGRDGAAAGNDARQRWNADRLKRIQTTLRRKQATIDYLAREPIGPPEGVMLVWAGMRGAVSLAAAQTLPADTPGRPSLLLVAFFLAGGSLLLQGASLPLVVARFKREPSEDDRQAEMYERGRLLDLLREVAEQERTRVSGRSMKRLELDLLDAQRMALLDARDDGVFDAHALSHALRVVDAALIGLELRGAPDEE